MSDNAAVAALLRDLADTVEAMPDECEDFAEALFDGNALAAWLLRSAYDLGREHGRSVSSTQCAERPACRRKELMTDAQVRRVQVADVREAQAVLWRADIPAMHPRREEVRPG